MARNFILFLRVSFGVFYIALTGAVLGGTLFQSRRAILFGALVLMVWAFLEGATMLIQWRRRNRAIPFAGYYDQSRIYRNADPEPRREVIYSFLPKSRAILFSQGWIDSRSAAELTQDIRELENQGAAFQCAIRVWLETLSLRLRVRAPLEGPESPVFFLFALVRRSWLFGLRRIAIGS